MNLTSEQQDKNRKLCKWLNFNYLEHEADWVFIHAVIEKLTDNQLSLVLAKLVDATPKPDVTTKAGWWTMVVVRATKEQWVDALVQGLNL